MNPYTGDVVQFAALKPTAHLFPTLEHAAADRLGCSVSDLVTLEGTDEAVAELSHRARLGAGELERRRKRNRAQRAARRANRPG